MAETPDRRARLAQALRDNLKRRKEQERQRRDAAGEPSPAGDADGDRAPQEQGEAP